jgi:hypothetical protein
MSTLPYFYPKTSSHYSYVSMIWPFESFYSKRGIYILITTSVACAIGPSVNPLQNRETQHVNIVLQYMYQFFEQPNMKGNHAWIDWQDFKTYHILNSFFLPKPGF